MDLIVVFKKDVSEEKSDSLLRQYNNISFKSGMDSSRGKSYFYSTGPKYIVSIEDNEAENYIKHLTSNPYVHEIYEADWTIEKD